MRLIAALAVVWVGLAAGCSGPLDRLIAQGNTAARDGNLEAARSAYAEAVAVAPDSARAHLLLGNALNSLKKHDEAAAEWAAARTLNGAREALAAAALSAHDAGAALEWLGPTSTASGHVVQARAALALGQPDEALAALARVKGAEAKYLTGSAQLALRHLADAQATFDGLEREAPSSPFGAYGLARLAAVQGRAADTLLYLKAAKTTWGPSWNPAEVAADPAFAFLSASADFQELLK